MLRPRQRGLCHLGGQVSGSRVAIFIDGAYLGKVLWNHHGGAGVDYAKLAIHLAGGQEILRTYYYDALPYQSDPPTADERQRFGARQRYFDALRKLPRYEVREGRCARTWDPSQNRWKFSQKQVDVLLSVDLVRLASKAQISKAVLIAGDSDFLPAVKIAKDEGVSVEVIHSPNIREVHRDLWDLADDRRPFDGAMLGSCKR